MFGDSKHGPVMKVGGAWDALHQHVRDLMQLVPLPLHLVHAGAVLHEKVVHSAPRNLVEHFEGCTQEEGKKVSEPGVCCKSVELNPLFQLPEPPK